MPPTMLVKMKETVEPYLGALVTQAVNTVPAYFNDAQRRATRDAGTISCLDILSITNKSATAIV
ncbi:HSP70-domain-containing protein [Panus rudis PR-1116 ss-1]|nr:HSP70-domain-containing protein [Panus rudis PR-1116 ss-1]